MRRVLIIAAVAVSAFALGGTTFLVGRQSVTPQSGFESHRDASLWPVETFSGVWERRESEGPSPVQSTVFGECVRAEEVCSVAEITVSGGKAQTRAVTYKIQLWTANEIAAYRRTFCSEETIIFNPGSEAVTRIVKQKTAVTGSKSPWPCGDVIEQDAQFRLLSRATG